MVSPMREDEPIKDKEVSEVPGYSSPVRALAQ